MQDAIARVIAAVPAGTIFDSHYVIDTLILDDSDAYLAFASDFANVPGKTTSVHGHIGKQIALLDGSIVERVGDSWSRTIHGNPGVCTAWRKL